MTISTVSEGLFFWQVLLAVIFIIFMIQTVFIEAGSIENRTFGNSSLSGCKCNQLKATQESRI